MSFTLTFSPSLETTDPITVNTSESINIVFDTADNGATYTFTSSTGTITILDGFNLQTWSPNLFSVINIPNSVITLGNNAFSQCQNLSSITIPNTVTSLLYGVFYNCTSLSSITIPSSVTTIGLNAFDFCTSLTSITIPSSVTSIGSDAFANIPNLSSTVVTTPITPTPSYAFTWFNTEPDYTTYYSNITFQDPPTPYPCFKEGSKILTVKGYIPIQNLRKGDLIKTLCDGYKPVDMIGYREIENIICEERIKNKLYVCKQSEYPEIFEDLIITGCHSILVDDFKEGQREKTAEVLSRIFVTDKKYRLPACVDKRSIPYEKEGSFTIYHLALENNDYFMNYGIYANGLLVETCSKRYLKECSNMKLII